MRILFAVPHRLPFLTGSVNLLVLAAWWLWQLAALHAGVTALPQGDLPPVLLHGPAMLFLIFPPFVFGFLLTVFPRWMGFPDLTVRDFGPVSALLAAGSAIIQAALWLGSDGALVTGFGVLALGWLLGMQRLARVLAANRREGRPPCWHGWSALGTLTFGLAGLLMEIVFLPRWIPKPGRPATELGFQASSSPSSSRSRTGWFRSSRATWWRTMHHGGPTGCWRFEPPRDCRRPFGLSYAAMGTSSSVA